MTVCGELSSGRLRVGFNRDELRSRVAALPPQRLRYGGRIAIHPLDPPSGGTWIAVNDAGVVMALLNRFNHPVISPGDLPAPRPDTISRGKLIPSLLHLSTVRECEALLRGTDLYRYMPFRLIVLDGTELLDLIRDEESQELYVRAIETLPLLFASSGLGDDMINGVRRPLFNEMLGGNFPPSADDQDAFHAYRWEERPEVSVCMERAEALTVSYTVIERDRDRLLLRYRDAPPCRPGRVTETEL
jgi:hypothetical protein